MILSNWSCLELNPSYWICLELNPSYWSCLEMISSHWICLEMIPSHWCCLELNPSHWICLELIHFYWSWLEMISSHWSCLTLQEAVVARIYFWNEIQSIKKLLVLQNSNIKDSKCKKPKPQLSKSSNWSYCRSFPTKESIKDLQLLQSAIPTKMCIRWCSSGTISIE